MHIKSHVNYVPTRFGVYWHHLQGAPSNCKLFAAHHVIIDTFWPLVARS